MINNNKEDREDMVQEIRESIQNGTLDFNMNINNLSENLIELGYDYTAEYIEEEKEDSWKLIELALNGKWGGEK